MHRLCGPSFRDAARHPRRLIHSVLAILLLVASPPARAEGEAGNGKALTPQLLDAVVKLRAQVPADARTAGTLGTEREGSGIVIDADGLIVTVSYLVMEAMAAEVIGPDGKPVQATIVGFDPESGLGLVRTIAPLGVKPAPLGSARDLREGQPVLVAGAGGIDAAQPAVVVSRRSFAGTWEYLLDDAIFTAPPLPNWGGAALFDAEGKLAGVGSLMVGDAKAGDEPLPGNMFVPIDRLKPVLADLLTSGRIGTPPHPWLGLNAHETPKGLIVIRVSSDGPAQKAGLSRGDRVTAVAGEPVKDLASFYRRVWAQGAAGAEVPLTVMHDGEEREIRVKSIDRYKWLKLDTSY